jgi:hypothetical protein
MKAINYQTNSRFSSESKSTFRRHSLSIIIILCSGKYYCQYVYVDIYTHRAEIPDQEQPVAFGGQWAKVIVCIYLSTLHLVLANHLLAELPFLFSWCLYVPSPSYRYCLPLWRRARILPP